MKYLIIYMSHFGTTRKVVDQLCKKLGTERTTVIDLDSHRPHDFHLYDMVIVGGSVYAGHVQPRIRNFCLKHKDDLLNKRLALFLCFIDKERSVKEFEEAFPAELRRHSESNGLLGGELLIDEMNFMERLVVRKMGGIHKSVFELDQEAINEFTNKILEAEHSQLHAT